MTRISLMLSMGGKQCILLRNCLYFVLRTDFGSPDSPATRTATPTGSVGTAWVHWTSVYVVAQGNSRHGLERGFSRSKMSGRGGKSFLACTSAYSAQIPLETKKCQFRSWATHGRSTMVPSTPHNRQGHLWIIRTDCSVAARLLASKRSIF